MLSATYCKDTRPSVMQSQFNWMINFDSLSDSSLSGSFSFFSRVGLLTVSVSSDPLKYQIVRYNKCIILICKGSKI